MSRTDWEVVIGLEVHTQLNTQSKIFSGASIAFGAEPNAQACAVDIALPGVLPVLNKGAVERAIRFGLAVGATVAPKSIFARKNYFYPDLPKGYQISQYELPVVVGGQIDLLVPDGKGGAYEKRVNLTRAHLEEDAGKSLHEDFHGMTGIDLNRAGTPLLEIVSEPDMRSSAEAVAYAKALHALVRWIDICDGNMQEGSFRCDANVSVRPRGQAEFGTRREIKNLNSFRFLQQAIDYEMQWQIDLIEDGGKVQQATVLFDPDTGETRAMRSKEDAHDYRYFPDPDLLPLVISAWIEPREGRDARAARRPVGPLPGRIRPVRLRRHHPHRQPRDRPVLPGHRRRRRRRQRQDLRQLGDGRSRRAPQQGRARHHRQPGERHAARRPGGAHRRQHHLQRHRQEGLRGAVEQGGATPPTRSSKRKASSRSPTPAPSRRSSTRCWPPTRNRWRNSAPARRRPSTPWSASA
jgi:hypothetical protein